MVHTMLRRASLSNPKSMPSFFKSHPAVGPFSSTPRIAPGSLLRRYPLPILLTLVLIFLLSRSHVSPPSKLSPPSDLRVVIVCQHADEQALATLHSLKPQVQLASQIEVHVFGNVSTTALQHFPQLKIIPHPPRPYQAQFSALSGIDLPTLYLEAGTLLAPSALAWLQQARDEFTSIPSVAGFMLDAARPRVKVAGPDYMSDAWSVVDVPASSAAFMYKLCVGGVAFMPNNAMNHAVWDTFAEWLSLRRGTWYKYPTGDGVDETPLGMGDLPERNWTRAAWNVWFSKFVNEYQLSIVYPNLPSGAVLARNPASDRSRDMRMSPSDLTTLYGGRVEEHFQMSDIPQYDAKGRQVDNNEEASVRNGRSIAQVASSQGGIVSFTMVNNVFLETAHSWICNVDVAGFRPRGLVWAVTDEETRAAMSAIPHSHTVLLSAIEGGKETGHEFGNPGYWKLMLERTALINEILKSGTAVFAFETDAIWLEDPWPYIQDLVQQGADIVGTINTRMEVSGNFFYLQPTLATRRLWNEITTEFDKAYNAAHFEKKNATSWTYIENDQSLLTKLVLRNETWRASHPLSFLTLDMERFTDGRWYKPEEGFYKSERARKPVVINNNFVIGVDEKTKRAKKWGHWFWDESTEQCLDSVVQKATAHPLKERQSVNIVQGHDGTHAADEARIVS